MITRRELLLASASALAISGLPVARGAFRGSSWNANVNVNFGGASPIYFTNAYNNILKGWSPSSSATGWPGSLSGTNGYPNGTISTSMKDAIYLDPSYFGHYLLYWTGTGAVGGIGNSSVIVYNNGAFAGMGNSGENGGNMYVSGTMTGVSNAVEFAFGALIGGVSTNGGLVQFTSNTLNRFGNLSTGTTVKFNNVTGLPAGPNPDGSWTINSVDNSTVTLQGSSAYAGKVGIVGGGPGVQSEMIYNAASTQPTPLINGTYSGFSNLVMCRSIDLSSIQAGNMATSDIVAAFRTLRPAYIRFMDVIGIQNLQRPSFTNRVTPNSFTWGGSYNPIAYWGGQISNTSDVLTVASNPSASPASGGYVEGEVVIAQIGAAAANTTQNPKLGITGRTGTAPIYTAKAGLLNITPTGAVPPSGTVLTLTFNGGGVSNFAYNYTTSTTVAGPAGVTDTSLQNIMFNIQKDINSNVRGNAGALVTAGITLENPTYSGAMMSFYYNQNITSGGAAQLGVLMSITGSDPTSNITFTFGLVNVGYLANGAICAFTYSALLAGWICTVGTNNGGAELGGIAGGPPLEYYAELCNRSGCGMWLNVGILDSASTIYNTVLLLAQANVKTLALEFGNENWNSSLGLREPCRTQAASLGFKSASGGELNFVGLRIQQMAAQATAAWAAAGRARSQLKIVAAYQFVGLNSAGTSDTSVYEFNGNQLDASGTGTNPTLKAYGGLGQTALTVNYSAAPNRPIDWSDWISPATYWRGGQYNSAISNLNTGVPLSAYNGMLLAAYNYAYGNTSQQQSALDFLYSISGNSGDLYNGTLNGSFNQAEQIASWAVGSGQSQAGYFGVGTVAASYDSSRSSTGTGGGAQLKVGVACYEGGWEMGPTYATQLVSPLNTLGYTNGYSSTLPGAVAGPTGSGDTSTTAAANLYNLLIAWKNDPRAYALVQQQFNQFKAAVNVVSTRDAVSSWYGFQGSNIWALYPGISTTQSPYQAYVAIATWLG